MKKKKTTPVHTLAENQNSRYACPEDVIRALLQRESQGASLRANIMKLEDRSLFNAALRYFKKWSKAVEKAGIDPEVALNRRTWTVQRVIDAIHILDRRGVPLNCESIRQADGGLPGAARKLLGSWSQALRVAGYDPDDVRVNRRPWTRQEIITLIRERSAAGLPVASYNISPASAEVAARRLFGSWNAALEAAGVSNPSRPSPTWTKVTVIEAILIRQENGAPLHCSAVATEASPLYDAGRKHFGSWRQALKEAGIDPQTVSRRRITPWTHQEVVEQLRQSKAVVPDVRRSACHPSSLAKTARRLFGSWRKALKAAGITPLTGPTKPVGKTVSGTLPRPLRAKRTQNASQRQQHHYSSKEEVIRAIMQREVQGDSLNAAAVKAEDFVLYLAALRYVGIWNDTLHAAGIDPETVGSQREWTTERIRQEIQRLARNGSALNAKAVARADNGLFQAAVRYWDSWEKALTTAGFDAAAIRVVRPSWTKPEIIEAIRAHAASGEPVLKTRMRPKSLSRSADRLFGSFEAAVRAAGVQHRRNLPFRWSSHAVIKAIQQRRQAGKALNSKAVTDDDGRLYDAARRFHGNWNLALKAAGIDPKHVIIGGRGRQQWAADQRRNKANVRHRPRHEEKQSKTST